MKSYFLVFTAIVSLLMGCDDENANPAPVIEEPRLLSYQSTWADFKVTANYEYDSEDRVKKIVWERSTPGITRGSDVFVYDGAGNLKEQVRSITGLTDETTKFTWENDKIFASTTYSNGNKIGFSFFDYNDKEQLEKVEIYRAQGGVGFLRTDSIGFTYHADGNLFRMFKYAFDSSTEKQVLISTEEFPEYLTSPNPVATVEILPVVNLQKTLPKQYTVAHNGGSTNAYAMQYKLRADGYPQERIVSGGTPERTIYTYDR
jgi:hypothetical protein